MRWIWNTAGLTSVGVGIVGAFVPVLPTTVFLILALWCFSKGSPRLEAWLLNHKVYGGALRRWRLTKAITVRGKVWAVTAMSVSVLASAWFVRDRAAVWITVLALGAFGAAYVLSRPTDQRDGAYTHRDQVA
ncbi:MAG: YbaN family protein [Fimbriimonadaceae bacterium]|nr:YbaN family protein [Fimbriimonadaceae bacterium]